MHTLGLSLLHRLQPYAEEASHQAMLIAQLVLLHVQPQLGRAASRLNASLQGLLPWQIAAVTLLATLLTLWALSKALAVAADIREAGKSPCSPTHSRALHATVHLPAARNV